MTTQSNICDQCEHAHCTGEVLKFMGKQIKRRICKVKKVGGQPLSITVAGYSQCVEFTAAQKQEAA